jgi:hypothetical protein
MKEYIKITNEKNLEYLIPNIPFSLPIFIYFESISPILSVNPDF